MELVLGGLSAVGVVLVSLWVWSLQGSVRRDAAAARERERQELERQELERREARRHQKGIRLQCLGCGHRFLGPLPDTGCPDCHLAALVVTEAEAKEESHGDEG